MADTVSKKKRSEIMSLVRSKNTKPELALRKLVSSSLYPLGFRYRLHVKGLPGSPDIAFTGPRVAIFLDGKFWHGFQFGKWKHKLEKSYWLPKIQENIRRDSRVNRQLRALGWTVIRIWEHEVKQAPDEVLKRIHFSLSNKLERAYISHKRKKRKSKKSAGEPAGGSRRRP